MRTVVFPSLPPPLPFLRSACFADATEDSNVKRPKEKEINDSHSTDHFSFLLLQSLMELGVVSPLTAPFIGAAVASDDKQQTFLLLLVFPSLEGVCTTTTTTSPTEGVCVHI